MRTTERVAHPAGSSVRTRLTAAVLTLPLAALAACSGAEATPRPPAAQIALGVANGAKQIEPGRPLTVRVRDGRLKAVTLADTADKVVAGAVSKDGASWTNASGMLPGTRYTLEVLATGRDNVVRAAKASFTTVSAEKTISIEEYAPDDGDTVGVGHPISINFSRDVTDRKAVQERLKVTTTPKVEGAWYWTDDDEVHWRPRAYWPASTKVDVEANLRGVKAGDGVYGTKDTDFSFAISKRANVFKVDLAKNHALTVYQNGEAVRTIPVTGGKSGFSTRDGVKVILTRERSHRMRSATIGIANTESSDFYDKNVQYALRVTRSGEFLHQAEWSTWAQGRRNVSHGCVGMSPRNARWFFAQAQIGDPVEVSTSTSKSMEKFGNGYGDWNVPWETWKKGNA